MDLVKMTAHLEMVCWRCSVYGELGILQSTPARLIDLAAGQLPGCRPQTHVGRLQLTRYCEEKGTLECTGSEGSAAAKHTCERDCSSLGVSCIHKCLEPKGTFGVNNAQE